MNQPNRRRTRIVNPTAQKRLILSLSVVPAIALAIMVTLVTVFCNQLYQESLEAQAQLDALMPLFLAVSGLSVATMGLIVWSALRLSHRIAGPAYRINQSLERIAAGDVAFEVTLREGDQLTDVAEYLNKVLDVLNENPPEGFDTRAKADAAEEAGGRDAELQKAAELVESHPSLVQDEEPVLVSD